MTTLANRTNTALLVIDVQNGAVAEAYERNAVIANIASLSSGRGTSASP
jgi:nicotinamidase-related amidase